MFFVVIFNNIVFIDDLKSVVMVRILVICDIILLIIIYLVI